MSDSGIITLDEPIVPFITPPAGSRIGMSDMNLEFAGVAVRRTGMAEAGTWIGIGAGIRHGFDSYWGRQSGSLAHRENITFTGQNTDLISSLPHIVPNLSRFGAASSTIQPAARDLQLRNPATGHIFYAGQPVEVRLRSTGRENWEQFYINGVFIFEWISSQQGGGSTTASTTMQVWYFA